MFKMKYLSLIGLFALVAVTSAKTPITPKNSVRVSPFDEPSTDACTAKCTPDCTTLVKCSGNIEIQVNCREQTAGQKPFCNSQLLQCDASSDFCPPEEEEDCDLPEGFYPNIKSCRSFFYCGANKKKINYQCQGNSVYNVLTEQCEVGVQCINFDSVTGLCKGKDKQLVPHPIKKMLYVYCINPPLLLTCFNENYEFDPTILSCNFICKKAGRFDDPERNNNAEPKDNIYFYDCVKNGAGFLKFLRKCADKTHFVPDVVAGSETGKGKCIPN